MLHHRGLFFMHACRKDTEVWTTISTSKQARRCLTNRFPYGIIYQIRDNTILIVAVWHLKRRPQTWQFRLKKNSQ